MDSSFKNSKINSLVVLIKNAVDNLKDINNSINTMVSAINTMSLNIQNLTYNIEILNSKVDTLNSKLNNLSYLENINISLNDYDKDGATNWSIGNSLKKLADK